VARGAAAGRVGHVQLIADRLGVRATAAAMNSVFSVPGALVFTMVIIELAVLFSAMAPHTDPAPTTVPATTTLTCEVSK